jgi:NodT family efflux transporter outer membrane factor (OMF) lipoprotein
MRSTTAVTLLACLALSACATARTADVRLPSAYEKPGPATNGAPPPAAAPAGAVALDRWWLAFNDTELTGLIDQALIHNPDARSAAARLSEARSNNFEAFTHYLPQGDLTGSTRRTDTHQLAGTVFNFPGFSSSGVSKTEAVNFNVSWEADIFGRIFATAKAANNDLAAARFNYEGARASLAANVADSYFLARGLAIQLADQQETARIEQSLYDTASKRAALGLTAGSEADRIAGDLAQAKSLAEGLAAQLQVQRRTLLILAGRTIEPTANINVDTSAGVPPPVPAFIPSDLLKRRPDVREAEARVAAATGRSQLDLLSFLPVLNFIPGAGWQKQEQPGFSVTARSFITGGAFTQPLLSIPRLLAELHAQDARTEQAVIAYERAVQTAFGDSESALVQLDADKRRVAILTDGEVRAQRAYRANQIGYERGLVDLQTTLSAEQNWRQIRAQLTAAEVQALRRTVQAYKSLGGGWPVEQYSTQAQGR